MVEVRAGLAQVTVTLEDRLFASHDRAWSTGQTITDRAHVAAAATLRTAFHTRVDPVEESLERNLLDYDTAFGVRFDLDGEVA